MNPRLVAEVLGIVTARVVRTGLRRARRGPARPSWSFATEAFVAVTRGLMDRSKQRGVPWLREVTEWKPARGAVFRSVRFEPVMLGGVRGLACAPAGVPEPSRTIVYLHGGGYVIGSPEFAREIAARLAAGAEARVVVPDYRLSPEHPFPAAQDDCLAAARHVMRSSDPSRVAFAGDSAGGALSVATLCALRDAGERMPAAAVLFCPWTEPLADGGSMLENDPFDFGDRALLVGWAEMHAGELALDPRVTVARAELRGLPPLLVQVGEAELLRDQAKRFAEAARAAGVEVELDVAPDMFHDWQLQADLVPEGARAVADACAFIRRSLPDLHP